MNSLVIRDYFGKNLRENEAMDTKKTFKSSVDDRIDVSHEAEKTSEEPNSTGKRY